MTFEGCPDCGFAMSVLPIRGKGLGLVCTKCGKEIPVDA